MLMPKNSVFTLTTVLLIACGGSAPPASPSTASKTGPICRELHEVCEPFEEKSDVAKQCHEQAHGATEEWCAGKKAECLAVCK